jgi:demethylmenaquinone methyltransferase/2-methoxy-6-polyprenyl-1,4-benzoquinol methylase
VGRDVSLFDRIAPLYDVLTPAADREPLERGLAYADRDVDRVLDVGGGTGRAGRIFARYPFVADVVVADAAAGMLRSARSQGLGAIQSDAGRLPVCDEQVDAVLVVDALHHFPDPHVAVREAARVLRSGGVLLVRDFDPETWRGRALVAVEHAIGFESEFFTAGEMADVVQDAGLASFVPDRGYEYTVVGVKRRD